jgi:hypothetical protein
MLMEVESMVDPELSGTNKKNVQIEDEIENEQEGVEEDEDDTN